MIAAASSLSWIHIGDLHMDEVSGWDSRDRLAGIVAESNEQEGDAAAFVYLPGDNANRATVEQYRIITETLAPLELPYRVLPGVHVFEYGELANYDAAFPNANPPKANVIVGHRCIYLDIASAGAGRTHFRLTMHHRSRLPGRDIHRIGAWPEHGIPGGQLSPNKNGKHW